MDARPPPYKEMVNPSVDPIVVMPPAPTHVIVTQAPEVVTGNCPGCRRGMLKRHYTCCGWLCCFFLFPCGIACCYCLSEKRCGFCGGTY